MASVEVSMVKNPHQQHEYTKVGSRVDYIDPETSNHDNEWYTKPKSSALCCHLPKGKDVMFGIVLLFCGITVCFNFVRICTLEERISELSQVNTFVFFVLKFDIKTCSAAICSCHNVFGDTFLAMRHFQVTGESAPK